MTNSQAVIRRRGDAEETRRRVLDAVVATVVDIGYYKASSNEIARRAGVTWGAIQHLFGSRDQLMLDVVNDIGSAMKHRFANAVIEGDTLEERLHSVVNVMSTYYEEDAFLVQMQILLELSSNPKMSLRHRNAVQLQNSEVLDDLAQPLLKKAIGELSDDRDLVSFAFLTLRGYLTSYALGRRMAALPDGAIVRLMRNAADHIAVRDLVVRGVARTIQEEAKRRGRHMA
jgi:AcrR family transcriptional regulator